MIIIVYGVHSLVCFALIVIVLLQTGKGSDMGSAFGGASQTVFGTSGRQTFLSRLTAGAAVVFMLTCLFLAWYSSKTPSRGLMKDYQEAPPAGAQAPTPLTGAPAPTPASAAPPAQPQPAPAAPQGKPISLPADQHPVPAGVPAMPSAPGQAMPGAAPAGPAAPTAPAKPAPRGEPGQLP